MRGVGTRVSPTTGFQAPRYAKPTRAHKRTGAKGVFGSISSQAKERAPQVRGRPQISALYVSAQPRAGFSARARKGLGSGRSSAGAEEVEHDPEYIVKKINVIAALAAVGTLGYLAASPWMTLQQMRSAAEMRDIDALAAHIDFSSVRDSLKDQIQVILAQAAAESAERGSSFGEIEQAFAGAVVGQLIDQLVTAEGLRVLMSESTNSRDAFSIGASVSAFKATGTRYASLNRFVVTIENPKGEEAELVLHRQGLGWKLADIRLPASTES